MKRESSVIQVQAAGTSGLGLKATLASRLRIGGTALLLVLAGFVLMLSMVDPARSSAAAQYLDDAAVISTGNSFSCAVRDTGNVMCWGYDLSGSHYVAEDLAGLSDGSSINVGESHGCGIRTSGQAACMGTNSYGELGNGTTSFYQTSPVSVQGLTNAIAISTGNNFSCAIRTGGQAVCWGNNNLGQLGDGTTTTRLTPTNVSGLNDAVAIEVGFAHACAIRSSGQAVCWGSNANGQLGDGTTTNSSTPVNVSGLASATAISAGGSHTCAIRNTAQAVCWGSNGNGRLGDGTLDNRLTPTNVSGLANATRIDAGASHSCAIRSTGQAICWGSNIYGQLGDSSTTERSAPVNVQGMTDAESISTGRNQTCAIRTNGQALCWGQGQFGQLGFGGDANQSAPVRVRTNKSTITATKSGAGQGTVNGASVISCGSTCSGQASGSVSLTAQASDGSEFLGWSGACTGSSIVCTLSMDQDRTVNAEFGLLPRFTLTVTKSGTGQGTVSSSQNNGLDCGSTCNAQAWGQVTLQATPASGSEFVGWTGACTGSSTYCDVTMSQARTVNAEFRELPKYRLTVNKTGTGQGTISSTGGINCGSTCELDLAGYVTLTFSSAPGSQFAGWGGCDYQDGFSCAVQMTNAKTVTAQFDALPRHTLSVTKSGTGEGTVLGPEELDCGSVCQVEAYGTAYLEAIPEEGSEFVGWTGACSGSYWSCSVSMTQARSVNAEFREIPKFTLSVTKSGTGQGHVSNSNWALDCGDSCSIESGGYEYLYASPSPGSEFVRWTGACSGTDESDCMVTMDQAQTVNAEFRELPKYTLSVTRSGTGQGRVQDYLSDLNCGAICSAQLGGTINLYASASPGSEFVRWTGACSGTDESDCMVTMDQARNVDAEFRESPKYTLNVTKSGTGQGSVYDSYDFYCGETCSAQMGGTIHLYASPSRGSEFVRWTGACTGTERWDCEITMDQARTVNAEFRELPKHTLTVTRSGSGQGNVADNWDFWCGDSCTAELGGSVSLYAYASSGSVFLGWSGACSGTLPWCEVEMDQARTVNAEFGPPPPRLVTVSKSGAGSGRIVSEPAGIDCGSTCQATLPGVVTLRAVPGENSRFVGWSGICSGRVTCSVPWDETDTATATFVEVSLPPDFVPPQPEVVPPARPGGGTVNVSQQVNTDTGEVFFTIANGDIWSFPGSCMPLTVDIPLNAGAGTISNVTLIHGGGTAAASEHSPGLWRATITCVKAGDLFVRYTLTEDGDDHVYTIPMGGITLIDPQGVVYDQAEFQAAKSNGATNAEAREQAAITGATVELQRLTGGSFVKVPSGDPGISPNVNPQTTGDDGLYQWDVSEGTYRVVVSMDGYETVTSDSVDIPPPVLDLHIAMTRIPLPKYQLTVSRSGTGQGSVSSSPAGINCGSDCSEQFDEGTVVTLSQQASTGSSFAGWSGACSGTGSCQVAMSQAKEVTATFTSNPVTPVHALSVAKSGTGAGSITSSPSGIDCGSSCSKSFDQGTVVTLTASAAAGSAFGGWSGACSGAGTCQVTMNEAKSVSAAFTLNAGPDPDPGVAELGPLQVTPKAKTVKRGKKTSFTVKIANTGTAAASGVKVCVSAPKKLVKVTTCVSVGTLAAGQTAARKFTVSVPKKAKKGKKATLAFTATASGLAKQTAKTTVKVG